MLMVQDDTHHFLRLFSLCLFCEISRAFALQEGGKMSHPRELTVVRDRDGEPQTTRLLRARQLI